jgi:hypothetical protein
MAEKDHQEAITVAEFVAQLGGRVTIGNVQGRIRRGSLAAYQDENGEWHIPRSELKRIIADVESCDNCSALASSFVIVKYHQHHRVEFALCDRCAQQAQSAYSRRGGVLEVVTYPLLGEGWLKH